jgi:uncharacterized protein (UPF0333 family)
MYTSIKSSGQAMVEYLFVMLFIVLISVKLVGAFTDFMRDSMGNLGHIMTISLTTGICSEHCFFGGVGNGYAE